MSEGLRQALLARYGLSIPDERWRALGPQIAALGPRHDWSRALRGEPDLRRAVLAFAAIDKTAFFRDPALFQVLEGELLPELIARARPEPARVWSAGCSRGQEPYSLALIAGPIARALGAPPPDILATDIRDDALALARAARYPAAELAALPRRFRFEDGRVPAAARARVRFEVHRLGREAPPTSEAKDGAWDLILCRNVLIYFPPELFCAAARSLAAALRPGGILALGACEMLREEAALFESLLRGEVFVYRKKP